MQSPRPAPSTQCQESLGMIWCSLPHLPCLVDSFNIFTSSKGPPTLELLMNFPTQGATINIIQEIGANYSNLGIFLLNDKNGTRIVALQRQHHLNAEDITKAIFQTWFCEGTEKSITWNTLVTALRKAGLNCLADKIMKGV